MGKTLDNFEKTIKELEDFNSMKSLEAIARNNLKMAGENEVLVIINKPKQEPPEDTKKKKK